MTTLTPNALDAMLQLGVIQRGLQQREEGCRQHDAGRAAQQGILRPR